MKSVCTKDKYLTVTCNPKFSLDISGVEMAASQQIRTVVQGCTKVDVIRRALGREIIDHVAVKSSNQPAVIKY